MESFINSKLLQIFSENFWLINCKNNLNCTIQKSQTPHPSFPEILKSRPSAVHTARSPQPYLQKKLVVEDLKWYLRTACHCVYVAWHTRNHTCGTHSICWPFTNPSSWKVVLHYSTGKITFSTKTLSWQFLDLQKKSQIRSKNVWTWQRNDAMGVNRYDDQLETWNRLKQVVLKTNNKMNIQNILSTRWVKVWEEKKGTCYWVGALPPIAAHNDLWGWQRQRQVT